MIVILSEAKNPDEILNVPGSRSKSCLAGDRFAQDDTSKR